MWLSAYATLLIWSATESINTPTKKAKREGIHNDRN